MGYTLLLFMLEFLLLASTPVVLVSSQPCSRVPALFLFGDSIADTGNNDRLFTFIRADFFPYGVNFEDSLPTGRFADGQLVVDFLASFLGLSLVPPYLLAGDNILQGVSFASSGSGILDSTGSIYGQHVPLSQQLKSFDNVKQGLDSILGSQNASAMISKSVYIIATGSNDFFEHYRSSSTIFNSSSPISDALTSSFQAKLISEFADKVTKLYSLGARKIVVLSIPAIGCVPSMLSKFQGQCVSSLNQAVQTYNNALLEKLKSLQATDLSNASLVYCNAFDLSLHMVKNPSAYGFKDGKRACCGWGQYNGATPCLPLIDQLCQNASEHVFWDFVHPTSAAYRIAAQRFWAGSQPDVTPINLQQLSVL